HSAGGGREAGPRGRQEEWRERPDDLRLAQTLRQPGAERREATAPVGAGKRAAEEDGRRPGPRDRRPEGDRGKEWWGHASAGSRWRTPKGGACRAAARAPCCPSRGPPSATSPGSSPATHRCSPRSARWPVSIRGTAIGRSASSSSAKGTYSGPTG